MTTDPITAHRTKWLDILKGIAICFVVLGHSPYLGHLSPKLFNIIFSFHMPLFIFIAGYLFNPGQRASGLFRKRFNSLLKPYFFTVIIISLPYILFKGEHSPLWYLFWMFYGNGPNLPKLALHLWFLPHLFLVTMFVFFVFRIFKLLERPHFLLIVLLVLLLVSGALTIKLFWNIYIPDSNLNILINRLGLFLSNGVLQNPAYINDTIIPNQQFILKGLPWCLDLILVSSAFFIAGYVAKNYFKDTFPQNHYIALIAAILFFAGHFLFNGTIDLNLRRYDHLLTCTMLATAGIYLCSYLSFLLGKKDHLISKGFAYVGRYSLIVYIFHLIAQSKAYFAISSQLPNKPIIAFIPALIAGIVIPLLLNYLVLNRFSFFKYWYHSK